MRFVLEILGAMTQILTFSAADSRDFNKTSTITA